jgi:hypothetical protein
MRNENNYTRRLAGSGWAYHCRTVLERLTRCRDYLYTFERKWETRDGSHAQKLKALNGKGATF